MDDTSATPPKNIETALHKAIDKVTDKEVDMIAGISDTSHKVVESLAYRTAQLEDNFYRILDKSRSCIQSSPFKCLGIALAISFVLAKLLNSPRRSGE
jgi:ElaB/YqjD/DUF883 family membrane-anchored ribosome-binding protein